MGEFSNSHEFRALCLGKLLCSYFFKSHLFIHDSGGLDSHGFGGQETQHSV